MSRRQLKPGITLCLVLALFFTSLEIRASGITPESIEGTVLVTAEDLIDLVESKPNLVIIDSRIPGDRKQGYVEGSLSLPDVDTTCETLQKKIPETDLPALFYCNGIKCGRSAKAVKIALTCGYKNIYWFRGGFKEWLAKGYPFLQQ